MEIRIVEYNHDWPGMYIEEVDILKKIFSNNLVSIHHIGSTSVPGLKAKPIIDILPVVSIIEKVDDSNEEMIANGYEPLGEFGIIGRRYFRKGKNVRTHQVHVFQEGSIDIERHLAFRDYLRFFPDEAKRYGELKAHLAKCFLNNPQAYMDGKDGFIKERERMALAWVKTLL